jgi:hypothetical protein
MFFYWFINNLLCYKQKQMMLKFYLWLMGWSGTLSAWAWRKHARIIRGKRK